MSLDREKARDVLRLLTTQYMNKEETLDRLAECVTPDPLTRQGIDAYVSALAASDARITAVLALHVEMGHYTDCQECGQDWPCATARACGVD